MGLINSAPAIFTAALVILGSLLWTLIKMVGGPQLRAHEVLSTGLRSYFHMDHRPYGPYPHPRRRKKYKPVAPQFTENQILEFEIMNFENYCHFHRIALKKVLKGALPHDVFSSRERQLLHKRGVLLRRNNPTTGARWIVTPRAIETLKTL